MMIAWATVLLFGVVAAVPLDSHLTLDIQVHNVQMKVNPCPSPAASGLSDHDDAFRHRCNITFKFCLGPLQATKGCQYGEFITTYSVLQDAATQGFFLSGPRGFPFPKNVTFSFLPKLLFELRVEALCNSLKKESPVDTLLVTFGPDLSVKPAFSELQRIDGKFGRVSLELTYRLTSNCPKDFYGKRCSVSCKLPKNSPGKYTCNYLGQPVCFGNRVWPECTKCRPGYNGPDCSLHSGNEKATAQEYVKKLFSLEYTSHFAQRQVDNDNSTNNNTQNSENGDEDDSSLSSDKISGIVESIGYLYLYYMGYALWLYFEVLLADQRNSRSEINRTNDCMAIVLFGPYIFIMTLLFPFLVWFAICVGVYYIVCALANLNKN